MPASPNHSSRPVQKGESNLERIEAHLSKVHRRNGKLVGVDPVIQRTPLSELLEKEAGLGDAFTEDEIQIARSRTFRAVLRYVFANGPHPGETMRRLYVLARTVEPDLILRMNGTDLAVIFDETRAAQSERVELMFNGYLKKAGQKGTKLPFQKLDSSCQKMAAAQRGNQNRRGKKIARAARAQRGHS